MKKVIRLTEADLTRIVKRVIEESKYGSFDDEEWYDEKDSSFSKSGFDDMEFDDEEFDDFDNLQSKHGHDTKWFGKGESGKKMFDTYKDKHKKPFKVRTRRGIKENDENEDNSDKIGHTKKQFLNLNKFNHLKSQSIDGNNSIDIYGKKYHHWIVFMHVIEVSKENPNYNGDNYLVKFDVKPNGLEYVKFGEEENIGKKGWIPVKYLTDDKVEEYMKNAANYGEYKYDSDNAPKLRF